MKKKIIGLLCGLLCMTLTGCGQSYKSEIPAGFEESASTTDSAQLYNASESCYDEAATSAENENSEILQDNRKLIKTMDLDAETKEFDKLLSNLEQKVKTLGGYIENMNVNGYETGRYAYMTARIPADKLDVFVTEIDTTSNITRRNEYVEDVTLNYVDLESHKKMLKAEEESLLGLLEKAESVEDIVSLESRLTEVRYQIESMESQLRTFDNQITYSTVNVNISEVEQVTPPKQMTASERIAVGFTQNVKRVFNGLENFGIALVVSIPFIILLLVIILIIVVIIKVIMMIISKNMNKNKHQKGTAMPVQNVNANIVQQSPVQQSPVQGGNSSVHLQQSSVQQIQNPNDITNENRK